MARSPIELLGAVLDEVEGIRQTDKRSHLPKMLMLELKDALQPAGSVNGCGAQLRDVGGLVGETIAQVFYGVSSWPWHSVLPWCHRRPRRPDPWP